MFNNLNVNVYDKIYSTGGYYVGGLGGYVYSVGSVIRGSGVDVNYISVVGNSSSYVGGLVGNMDGNVYVSRVVFGRIDVNKNGGDFGYFGGLGGSVGFVSGCSSVGEGIDATLGVWSGGSNRGYVGGLVGYSKYGVMGSSSRGDFILANKTNGSYVGGLVGSTTGLVVDSNAF